MDKEKIILVKAWLLKAHHDLISVRKLVAGDDPMWDTAIYHCQQAAEKALKGFLIFYDIRFRKTHDLEKLIELCQSIDEQFSQWMYAADILTPYAAASRYPDKETPKMAKADVEAIYEEILKLTHDEKVYLLHRLAMEVSRYTERDQGVTFYDIKGIGKEIWEGTDAQEYVNKERASWDKKDNGTAQEDEEHS